MVADTADGADGVVCSVLARGRYPDGPRSQPPLAAEDNFLRSSRERNYWPQRPPLKTLTILASFCQNRLRAAFGCSFNYCNRESFVGAPHRRLELQICVATALAVHSDPWPVTFSPLPIESSRACAALAGSRSQTSSGLPLTCLADWAVEKRAGLSLSSACVRESHNIGCSKYRTGIDGAHSARGADRSALRRRGARALGLPRWHPARRSHPQAFPPLLTMLDWNKREE